MFVIFGTISFIKIHNRLKKLFVPYDTAHFFLINHQQTSWAICFPFLFCEIGLHLLLHFSSNKYFILEITTLWAANMTFWQENYPFIKDVYLMRQTKMVEWMENVEKAISRIMADKVYTSAEFKRERDNFNVSTIRLCIFTNLKR